VPPVIYWVHVAACALMRLVPVGVAYRVVGWGTPVVLTFFARGYQRRAMANMRQVLGPTASEREVRHLTRLAFTNYGRYMVDLLRLPYLDIPELVRGVVIHGWENVDAAFAQGLGVVIVTGHIGSWDLAGAVFAGRWRSSRIGVLTDTLAPARWNERVQRIRNQVGMRAIPIESGAREMLATLRRGEGLAVLVDKPLSADDGVMVTFFGRATRVPTGAATLALRTGSPLLPAVLVHAPQGSGYVAYIGQPIPVERARRSAAEVQAVTQRIMGWLEGIIRQHPDQWYMFRAMWPEPGQPVA
jgi:lauroyl/myristoyl acyltransferase